MQKRLLALVATVAMVLSMFAGIAFAAADDSATWRADSTGGAGLKYFFDEDTQTLTIHGKHSDIPFVKNPSGVYASWVSVKYTMPEDLEGAVLKDSSSNDIAIIWVDGEQFTTTYDYADEAAFKFYFKAKPGGQTIHTVVQWTENTAENQSIVIKYVDAGYVDPTPTEPEVTPNAYKMNLATTKVIAGGSEFQPVVGSISRTGTANNPVTDFVLDVTYTNAANTVVTDRVNVPNGQISFYLPTNIAVQDVTFRLYPATDTTKAPWTAGTELTEGAGLSAALPKLPVRYNVALSPSDLEFPYTDTQSPVAITGKVTDRKGNPVKQADVKLVAPGSTVLDTLATDAGEFGFVVLQWADKGPIDLLVKGLPAGGASAYPGYYSHVEGEVIPRAANLTVTPKSAVHSLLPVTFTVSGTDFAATDNVSIKLYKGTKDITAQVENGSIPKPTVTDGKFVDNAAVTFKWTPAEAGTYTVKAIGAKHGASATITVSDPLAYNFINSEQLTTLKVASYDLLFGKQPAGTYLVTYDGKDKVEDFVYDVYVDGTLKLEKKATGSVAISNTKLGTKNFRVIAYKPTVKDGSVVYTKVYEQTFVGQITGWDVTMEPTSLTVNKAENISFVIKDKDGVPVNNATILIDGKVYSSPSTYNAQDGTYVLKDVKFSTVGVRSVEVKRGNDVWATLKLDVVGEKVYNVTADIDALLQGKAQDIKLTVTRDGKAVIPQRVRVIEKKLDPKELSFTPAADGVTKINVKAAKAGELIVRVENYDGTLCGEVAINVVAPKLVLIDEEVANVTDNFKTDVHFKVVDPRDDSVIKSNLYLEGAYLTDLVIYNEHGGTIVNSKGVFTILGAAEHKLTILAKDGLYDDAADEEEDVLVGLRVGAADGALVDGEFLVKEATIESDPGMIIVGAQNNLTLTYKDANGNPIVGKAMKAGEASLGKTDDKGQVIYPVGMPTGSVKVTGDTDVKDVVVEHTIKIGYDAEAPKVTHEIDGNKATIVISDNVRLVRVNIDGKDIDFWPGAKYEFVKTLNPGVNKVHIKAQDSSDNVFDEVVEIEYLTDAIVLKGDQVHRDGDFLYVQARQFEDFGAKFAWNQATKTAKFVVGETTVEVTIGSTTAKINGEAVTMPVAPFIKNDRTYVPVRFVSENLNWGVYWKAGDIVTITLP